MTPRILVAGVGNIFRGDDAFGVEVVRGLIRRPVPEGVRAIDFGIRGHDLAYTILDGYDVVILVDAARRDGEPGTLYTLEINPARTPAPAAATHGVDLAETFRLVEAMGGSFPKMYLVGCEPADLGSDEEGRMGLSEPVRAAVEQAVERVLATIAELHHA
jgi:hydrogenase maturation protease